MQHFTSPLASPAHQRRLTVRVWLLLALAALLAIGLTSLAQAQNVGIGITSPTQTLDVNGNLRVRGLSGPGDRLPVVQPDGTLSVSPPVYGTATTVLFPTAATGIVGTGSAPRSVVVSGTTAYVVNQSGNTLQVFTLANPASPVLIGSVGTGSRPYGLAVSGTTAYVVNAGSNTLQLFNVANPASPVLLGSVGTGVEPVSVTISGTTAYVVNFTSNTLQAFNVANPASPVLIGSVSTGTNSQPFDVAVSGTMAYVVTATSHMLRVYNVTNPASLVLLGTTGTGNFPSSVAVSGTTAYVVNLNSNTLQAFNVANPASPVLLGSVGTGNGPYDVAVRDTTAYVVNYSSNSLQAFSVANSATPVLLNSVSTGNGPANVAVSGTTACVVNQNSNTLQIFTFPGPPRGVAVQADGSLASVALPSGANFIRNGTTPQAASNFNVSGDGTVGGLLTAGSTTVSGLLTAGSARVGNLTTAGVVTTDAAGNLGSATATSAFGTSFIQNGTSQQAGSNFNISGTGTVGALAGTGTRLVTANAAGTLGASPPVYGTAVSVPPPFAPGATGSVSIIAGPIKVAVSGTTAYVLNYGFRKLEVFDVANPARPTLLGSVPTSGQSEDLAVSGTTAYVVDYTGNTLHVFDVANPANPTLRGSVGTGSFPIGVAASGTTAYVVNLGSNTLQVFDVANPASPAQLGSVFAGSRPYSVTVSGTTAYVVNNGSNTLRVFNVANPASPTLLGSVGTDNSPFSVAVSGTTAYVANLGSSTLQTFNVANPASPALLGSVATDSQPNSVAVSGTTAFVVNRSSNTLQAFNVTNPASPTLLGSVGTGNFPASVAVNGTTAYVVNQSSNTLQTFSLSIGPPRTVAVQADGSLASVAMPSGADFIQNSTSPQAASNFNVSGNGTVGGLLTAGSAVVTTALGIGTSTPAQALHLTGRMQVDGGVIQRGGLPITGTADLGLYSRGAGNWLRFVTNNGAIRFYSDDNIGTTPNVSFMPTGSVGIGTDAPAQTLHVAGRMQLDNGVIQRGGAAITATTDLGLYQRAPGNWMRFVTNGGAIRFYADDNIGTTPNISFMPTGNVGIGTDDPQARLHVNGGSQMTPSSPIVTYMNRANGFQHNASVGGASRPVVAYFTGGQFWVNETIITGALNVSSDARIKHIVGLSDRAADLALLNRLRITDYTYLDQLANTDQVVKKVIAQEVKALLPAAVTTSTQAIPNVYGRATRVTCAAGNVTVTMARPHELPAAGGRMRFYTAANEDLNVTVEVLDNHTVRFAAAKAYDELFVYGKFVDDFLSVDYDALTTLNISATQELARKVAQLEQQNAALQGQVQALRRQADQSAADHAALLSLQQQLARLLGEDGQARK